MVQFAISPAIAAFTSTPVFTYFLDAKSWLWERNAEIIQDLWEERKKRHISLAIILGSIGNGKTSIMSLITWLLWYEVTIQYKKSSLNTIPQEYFGLRPASKIAIISLSTTVKKATEVMFNEVKNSFSTGFNHDYFPHNPRIKSMLDIERNNTIIFPNTATAAGILGYNVYSAAIDEAAFLEVIEDSKRGEEDRVYDQAESLHNATKQRMRSRFGHKNKGMIVMGTSINHPDDYVIRKAKEAYNVEDTEIFYSLLPEWQVKPTFVNFPADKFFYFDTEKIEVIKDEGEIALLDKNYIQTEPVDILFGDIENDPNDIMIDNFRRNKQKEEQESDNR